MLQLTYGSADEKIIVTLSELVTVEVPYYLFVFTHVETKSQVSKVFSVADDESTHQSRYNKFTIDTASLFNNKPVGEWHYRAYQQEDDANIDPEQAVGLIESGKLILNPSTAFEFTKYDEATTYKTYNG
jgi:hypothetical protein